MIDYSFSAVAFAMPDLLAKMGAEVLALNPYTSTLGIMSFDRDGGGRTGGSPREGQRTPIWASSSRPDGERLTVIDGEGRILDDTQVALAFVSCVADHLDGDAVAAPVTFSDRLRRGARRVRRVGAMDQGSSSAALMDAATTPGVGAALDAAGGYILPGFLPAFDGAAAMLKMLRTAGSRRRDLAAVVDNLPPVHRARQRWSPPGTRRAP